MRVEIQDRVYKELSKIDRSQQKKILKAIKNLENYPDVQNIKKLKNFQPNYRFRVGNYRVLFDIEDDTIVVSGIRHRKNAYD
jgi:mRNA interferase RelE/StbE